MMKHLRAAVTSRAAQLRAIVASRAARPACLFFCALFLLPSSVEDTYIRGSTAFFDQHGHRLFRFDIKADPKIRLGDAGQVAIEMSSVGIPLVSFAPKAAASVSINADALGGCSLYANLPTIQWIPTEGHATDFGWYIRTEKPGPCNLAFNIMLPAYGFLGVQVKIDVDDSSFLTDVVYRIPSFIVFACTVLTAIEPAKKLLQMFRPKPPPPPPKSVIILP